MGLLDSTLRRGLPWWADVVVVQVGRVSIFFVRSRKIERGNRPLIQSLLARYTVTVCTNVRHHYKKSA